MNDWNFTPGTGDGEFGVRENDPRNIRHEIKAASGGPRGISVAPDGCLYIADRNNHRIQKFTSEGVFLAKWGTQGVGNGQFSYPESVAVSRDGSIYVADSGNQRIQKFSIRT